jgi:hypothetical protein
MLFCVVGQNMPIVELLPVSHSATTEMAYKIKTFRIFNIKEGGCQEEDRSCLLSCFS